MLGYRVRRRAGLIAAGAGLFLAFGLAGSTAAERSLPMARQFIEVAGRPNAVCNDGTLPIYYFQPGSGDDAGKWVIYFQGGGGCSSDAACRRRPEAEPGLITSTDLPPTIIPDGILSTLPKVNPDFANYAHVFVHYCSSDGYAGDTEREIDGATWQFRGREIVDALFDDLSTRSIDGAPTLSTATEVFVTGSSAGAMGVHNNLDRIAARFPTAKVRGLADSVWIPPGFAAYGPGTFDVRPDQSAAFDYAKAAPDDSCVAANPDQPGRCLSEPFVLPYIETPMFIYADQRDPALLGVLGIANPPADEDQERYVTRYSTAVRDSLADVAAYFAPRTGRHTVLMNPRLTGITIGDRSFAQAVHDWYFGEPGDIKLAEPPGEAR